MVIDTQDMRADEYVSSIPPEAAHAVSEYPDTSDLPRAGDDGVEMLGRLLVYAVAVVAVIGCIGVASYVAQAVK